METMPPAARHLDSLGIPYRVFKHTRTPTSLEDAARARGQDPSQVIRSIVFRLGEGQYVMVLIAGPGQISWKSVRASLGVSRMTMASEAEVLQATGFVRGAVGPLGLPEPMRTLADTSVFAPEEISLGSGIRGTAIIMKPGDLRKALNGIEVGNFS